MWLKFAQMHIEDEGVAGTLARALATVCDPDIYVITPTDNAYYEEQPRNGEGSLKSE